MKILADYINKLQPSLLKAEKKAKKESYTLFTVEPNWEALKEKRCPICNSLLKKLRTNNKIVMCRGLRHGDRKPFIITAKSYYRIAK